MTRGLPTVAVAGLALLGSAPAAGEDPPPRLVAVERGPFEVALDLEGVFDEPDARIVAYRPEVPVGAVSVIEAAAPGPVTQGQVLVRLRAEALDERIRRTELELAAGRHRVQLSREQSRRAEEQTQLELLHAELQLADAQRALDQGVTIDNPQELEQSGDRVRDWELEREEREAEFQILVAMYEADAVVEAAERLDIEQQQRRLRLDLLRRPHLSARHDVLERVTLPRRVAQLELAVREARHARDLLRATSAARVEQASHERAQAELALEGQERTLAALLRDREALTVLAPRDGVAIAGHFRGRWQALDETPRRLRPGARVAPGQVLFSIVQAAPRQVRTSIPEALLLQVRGEQEATLVPTSAPGLRLPAHVTRVAPYPVGGRCAVWLDARTRHRRLLPGSTCRVHMVVGRRPAALTVPADAIRSHGAQAFVDVWREGVISARPVVVGLTSGGRTEILGGLSEGEQVLARP